MQDCSKDYLLGKKVVIYQPKDGYRASIDAVFLASSIEDKNKENKKLKILDVGAGTGAVSLCLAHRIENCEITSIEIQENLSKIIEKSVKENGFSNKINIINSDIKNIKAKDYANSFDYVLTNPPYSSDKMMASPNKSKATAHNETSVDLRQWLDFSIKMLKPRGCFSMIYRIDRLDEILHILYKKLGRIEVVPLFSKEDKEAKRVVIRGRKSTKTPFCLKKGIVIHQNDGQYTKKAQEILIEAKSLL